jgi:hypothetical protein
LASQPRQRTLAARCLEGFAAVNDSGYERPAIAGSGVIACGLAASATAAGKVRLLARSDASAWRAEE